MNKTELIAKIRARLGRPAPKKAAPKSKPAPKPKKAAPKPKPAPKPKKPAPKKPAPKPAPKKRARKLSTSPTQTTSKPSASPFFNL